MANHFLYNKVLFLNKEFSILVTQPNNSNKNHSKKKENNKETLLRSNSTTTQESDRIQSVFERLAKPKHG